MLRKWSVVLIGVLVLVGVAGCTKKAPTQKLLTPENVGQQQERAREENPPRSAGKGQQSGQRMLVRGVLREVAQQTGIEQCDLLIALSEGQTLSEIIEGAGGDPQDVIDAVLEKLSERLAQAVSNGRITQEQADETLEKMADKLAEAMQADLSEQATKGYQQACNGSSD